MSDLAKQRRDELDAGQIDADVEARRKHAVGARLKRAGMHWSVDGANATLALRCCIPSGRFDDFWERRHVAG